ncbi:TlpA family protein disulfide reductase [bacterium]|jgi:thiol-disulfide isomerase/thioredoxin|nr:TlpA family protein disulfide reductase [bacterium]
MTKRTCLYALMAILAILAGIALWQRSAPRLVFLKSMEKLSSLDREKIIGKHVLLHFWAKWCEPCAEELPHLLQFARNARFPRPLEVLAVSLDPTLEEALSLFPASERAFPENFLIALDPAHEAAEAMGSFQYPETYLIDPDGRILDKWVGPQQWQKPEVLEFFRQKLL